MIAVYFASKARHAPFVQALRAAGINITATWPDWPLNYCTDEPTADQWQRHVQACIEQAAAADITLLYAQAEETQFGSLIECGAALAAGRQIYLVSPHAWPFLRNHPRVRSFGTLAEAVDAIMAGAQGARVTSISRTERRRRAARAGDHHNKGRDRSSARSIKGK